MYEILTNRSVIAISGQDVIRFLQKITTNDIKKNDYCYTYILNSQGRYLFDFFVCMLSETKCLIDINHNQADLFIAHLMMYKLHAKIEINNLSNLYQVIYSKEVLEFTTILSKQDPRYNLLGFRSIIDKEISQIIEEKDLYRQDKYNFAIVDGYEDLIYNRSIPIEYGAEELGAINYNKGCYIGQEIISRTKYQGMIRKRIFKLSSTNLTLHSLSKGDEIIAKNIRIGLICSTYKNNAIALVREEEYLMLQNTIVMVADIPVILSVPPWRC